MKKDMLLQDKFLITVLIFWSLFSCNNTDANIKTEKNKDVLAIQKSKQFIGEDNYLKVYKIAEDTLKNWIQHERKIFG